MDENQLPGGAGPALAAHSKDGSAPGPTHVSSARGDNGDRARGEADNVSKLTGGARAAVGRAATTFVQDQPIAALAVTGMIGLALGVMLARP